MLCQPSVPKKRVHTGAVLGTVPGGAAWAGGHSLLVLPAQVCHPVSICNKGSGEALHRLVTNHKPVCLG